MSDHEVRARAYVAVIIGTWFLRLFFPVAVATLLIIWTPVLADMVIGRRTAEPFSLLAIPFVLLFLGYVSIRVWRKTGRVMQPYRFDEEGFERLGVRFPWDSVSRVHENPRLSYLTILFKGLEPPGDSPGFALDKDRLEPSLEAFLALLREKRVVVDPSTQIRVVDLHQIQGARIKERGEGGDN